MNERETARALFGRTPEPEAEPTDQHITGPIILGQEKQLEYRNKTTTSEFIDKLFNN